MAHGGDPCLWIDNEVDSLLNNTLKYYWEPEVSVPQ